MSGEGESVLKKKITLQVDRDKSPKSPRSPEEEKKDNVQPKEMSFDQSPIEPRNTADQKLEAIENEISPELKGEMPQLNLIDRVEARKSSRNMENEENKEIRSQDGINSEQGRISKREQVIEIKETPKEKKGDQKPQSIFEGCLVALQARNNLLGLFRYLPIQDLLSCFMLNRSILKKHHKIIWSAIFCGFFKVSKPNPLIPIREMPYIIRREMSHKAVLLENLMDYNKLSKKQRIVEKGTRYIPTDKLLEKQVAYMSPELCPGPKEYEGTHIDIIVLNMFLSYYSAEKRLLIWRIDESSEAKQLAEMLHPIGDELKDCKVEGDRYLILKFERERDDKGPYQIFHCIDLLNIKEVKGHLQVKEFACLTIIVENSIPKKDAKVGRKMALKDPSNEDMTKFFTIEENHQIGEIRLKSEVLLCTFDEVKITKKNELACCVDYETCVMLLVDITRKEKFRLVPLTYCHPILGVQTITKDEKEYLVVVSNQEVAEICVKREAGRLKYESRRQKLPIIFQNKIKIVSLGEKQLSMRGYFIIYDDQKWGLYQILKGIIGFQEAQEWFGKNERAKIGEMWVQEKVKKGEVKERVYLEVEVVKTTVDWKGAYRMLVYKCKSKKLLNKEKEGKFKEVMRLRLEEDILYKQKIVRFLNYETMMMGYFLSSNIFENYFVVKFWKRVKKGEDAEQIVDLRRGVILKEPPGHKKLTWRGSMRNGKLTMTAFGDEKIEERFTFVLDLDNAWDAVGYEGKKKAREMV